jgi:peptidoglycan L-alanyl-D-glutamate endopeptidase CwlK
VTFTLGAGSRAKLANVHPRIIAVVERAIVESAQDFAVTDGVRTVERQRELVAAGRSRTMASRHLVQPDGRGHAVDLVPFIAGKVSWASWPAFHALAAAVGQAARALDVPLTWGGAWVETENVEGLAYFAPLKCGGLWYGAAPVYMQPYNGGTPEKVHHATLVGNQFGNGGKTEGPQYPFFLVFDPSDLVDAVAGTIAKNNTGYGPVSYTRMFDTFPDLIAPSTCVNTLSPYYGEETFDVYAQGNTVVFDPVTNQLVVWMTNGAVWSPNNILAFFEVR